MGVLCILQTWTRTLAYQPHVHCLVPAGGVSAARTEWRSARTSYLVPVQALSQLFRGLLRELGRQARPDLILPEVVWSKGWVVYCKPPVQGTEPVLNDLGRDVQRIALTHSRMLSREDGQVCFRYHDAQDQRWKTMKLPAHEVIRRFLQHVLPQGFHTVRYYGRWSPIPRPLLHPLQLCLAGQAPPLESPEPESHPPASKSLPFQAGQRCPHCAQGLLVVIRLLPRLRRGPP
jgi:Putative transposase